MCGIAGWYRRGGKPVPERALAAACDRIRHRGPDDAGYLADGDFGFGMRRLSIIDVKGEPKRLVFQAVHMILEGELQRDWKPDEERYSRMVFIGRNLDEEDLKRGFEACVA